MTKIFYILLSIIAVCILIWIAPERTRNIYTTTATRNFEILSINRPKHFSVDILDTVNHNLFQSVGRSKHCNSWDNPGNPRIHGIITLKIYYYYESTDTNKRMYYEPDDMQLNNLFCSH